MILVHNVCVEKIAEKFTKKGTHKVNYIADDLSSAKNYARKNIVGHNTEKIKGFPSAKSSNKVWQGWRNLDIGHIFLKDKIKNNGMWDDFIKEIESWKQ